MAKVKNWLVAYFILIHYTHNFISPFIYFPEYYMQGKTSFAVEKSKIIHTTFHLSWISAAQGLGPGLTGRTDPSAIFPFLGVVQKE